MSRFSTVRQTTEFLDKRKSRRNSFLFKNAFPSSLLVKKLHFQCGFHGTPRQPPPERQAVAANWLKAADLKQKTSCVLPLRFLYVNKRKNALTFAISLIWR